MTPYHPVTVTRGRGENQTEAGTFCNYGCLSAWLDETDAVTGACCRIDD
jgi:hypothetical protein